MGSVDVKEERLVKSCAEEWKNKLREANVVVGGAAIRTMVVGILLVVVVLMVQGTSCV